jgi:dihydrofolate reductase
MKSFQAIAAMAENRVIGDRGAIPWHLPDDFRWFKQATMGGILVMGRKTFESIGRPLPGRETIILSRSGFTAPGTRTAVDEAALDRMLEGESRPVWIAGGGEVYRQLLGRCDTLFLTRVKRDVPGDAWFPEFEADFSAMELVLDQPEFSVIRYERRKRA